MEREGHPSVSEVSSVGEELTGSAGVEERSQMPLQDVITCPDCSGDGCEHCDGRGWLHEEVGAGLGEDRVRCPVCKGGGEVGSFVLERECGGCAGEGVVSAGRAAELRSPDWTEIYSSVSMLLDANYWLDRDLRKIDLSPYDLRDEDLSGCNLAGHDLSGQDLRGSNLEGATLTGTNLSGTNLTNVSLEEAELVGAQLHGATLAQASLRAADLTDADLADADLSGANLVAANLTGANLLRTNLAGADLRDGNPEDACSLDGANLTGVTGLDEEQRAICVAKGAILDNDEEEA